MFNCSPSFLCHFGQISCPFVICFEYFLKYFPMFGRKCMWRGTYFPCFYSICAESYSGVHLFGDSRDENLLQLKLSPCHTLPPLLCFQLPMTFMFNLPDAFLLPFCQPSLQSEDFARLDRKTFVTLARTVHICILKGREMSAMVLGSKYPSLWAMAWTSPIYSGNP